VIHSGDSQIAREPLSGAGESEVLKSITVTISTNRGGRLPNLVADTAEATVDIRLPGWR
jgi:succinyl-diaminopimelate desuccinylase